MTMTLGFDVRGYLEALLDEDAARSVLATFGELAPGKPIRAAYRADDGYVIEEIGSDGKRTTPRDHSSIVAAIADAGTYVSWSNDSAPEGVPPIILPGGGWDLPRLLAEPALQKLIAAERFCLDIYGSDRARTWLDDRGIDLLEVADKYRLITVFR